MRGGASTTGVRRMPGQGVHMSGYYMAPEPLCSYEPSLAGGEVGPGP
jgi:hypothetical protein